MAFTELNAVEHYIIHQLTGVNLNDSAVSESALLPYSGQWQFQTADQLNRGINEVLVESHLKQALALTKPT